MILKLTNSTNEYTFEVTDLNHGEKLFYNFQIPTLDVEDGKYNMVITDDNDVVIAEEQVCIGYFNSETIQYQRAENVYINAPLEGTMQVEKNVEISEIETVIIPDDGFDAMEKVIVNAQPVYDNGYNQGSTDGYDDGYDAGDIDGYNRGYNEGETDQKNKLTGITITENGTYTREDGYNSVVVNVEDTNGSYDEGYDAGKVDGYDSGYTAGIEYASENAEEIAAANAIDLVATEIGTYYTKYSDNIVNPNPVTGIYPDGKTFYNLATTNNVYDTGLFANETTKIEFWTKFINYENITSNFNIITNSELFYNFFGVVMDNIVTKNITACVGNQSKITVPINYDEIYHIELSYSDGLIINGEQIGTFDNYGIKNHTLLLNGWSNKTSTKIFCQFGMIKITTDGVSNIIIPTENGFLNTTTNQLLEVVKNLDIYIYINNDSTILPNLIKSVNVQPKIDVEKYGIKFAYSTFKEVPDFYDFSNITNVFKMFWDCANLKTINLFDTSRILNMEGMFGYCESLIDIPPFITNNVTNMAEMFTCCSSLTTIPQLDTSLVSNMRDLFYKCTNLTTVPPLNAGELNMGNYYGLFGYNELPRLTDFGGLIGLKYSLTAVNNFPKLPNLTYQSCINILNGLYDFTGNGETPTSSQGQLKVHSNFLTTVGDEISIGTNKGWTISSS